jgi:hypothetical protein
MKVYLWGAIILLLLSACSQDSLLEGISQDSGKDAKVEQARIDLDNSNYDQVISDLSSIYNTTAINPDVAQLLASAYMGKAGIDLTIFIANSSSSGIDPYNAVTSMISSSDVTVSNNGRYIDGTLMTDYLENISLAEEILQVLVEKGKASNDAKIQLGVASAVHFVMNVGNMTADGLNTTLKLIPVSNRKPGTVPVPINTTALHLYTLSSEYHWSSINPSTYVDSTSNGAISSFDNDLLNIHNAIVAFSEAYPKTNRMRDHLNAFLYSALGIEPEVPITNELIMAYTSTGLNNYVQNLAK